jgi:hypothetical protein
MEFQKTTSAQTLELHGVVQGRRILIIVTQASANAVLEFQHAGDTWRVDPRFAGLHTSGVMINEIMAPSSKLRLRFLTAPTQPYFVSIPQEFTPSD